MLQLLRPDALVRAEYADFMRQLTEEERGRHELAFEILAQYGFSPARVLVACHRSSVRRVNPETFKGFIRELLCSSAWDSFRYGTFH